MQVQSQELRLMSEIGLMACARGDHAAALDIFVALRQERPTAPLAYIGSAFAFLHKGQLQDAIGCLEEGLSQVGPKEQPEMHAFLGLAYFLDKRHPQVEQALALAGPIPLALSLRRQIDELSPQAGGEQCS